MITKSVKDYRNFNKYISNDTTILLDSELFSIYHALVTADILVISEGCLSITTGLLNKGTIIVPPSYNRKQIMLDNWIKY